jgi:hypothetical protein
MNTFNTADIAEFSDRYRQFAKTLREHSAYDFFQELNNEEAFTGMRILTENLDSPALSGVVKKLAPAILATKAEDQDRLKMAIGALVSFIMSKNGFQKTGKKRAVAPVPVRIFRSGEVFERVPVA